MLRQVRKNIKEAFYSAGKALSKSKSYTDYIVYLIKCGKLDKAYDVFVCQKNDIGVGDVLHDISMALLSYSEQPRSEYPKNIRILDGKALDDPLGHPLTEQKSETVYSFFEAFRDDENYAAGFDNYILTSCLHVASKLRDVRMLRLFLSMPKAKELSLSDIQVPMLYGLAADDPKVKMLEHRKIAYNLGNGCPEILSVFKGFICENYPVSKIKSSKFLALTI